MILIAMMQILDKFLEQGGFSNLFSVKDEITNVLDFVGHMISFATAQFCC